MAALSRRDHSVHELQQKLYKKEFPAEEINQTIEKLRALSFLDDSRFAAQYARSSYLYNKRGPIRIALNLRQKGVGEDSIVFALENLEEELANTPPTDLLGPMLTRKLKQYQSKEYTPYIIHQKLCAVCIGRGFSSQTSIQVVESVLPSHP